MTLGQVTSSGRGFENLPYFGTACSPIPELNGKDAPHQRHGHQTLLAKRSESCVDHAVGQVRPSGAQELGSDFAKLLTHRVDPIRVVVEPA